MPQIRLAMIRAHVVSLSKKEYQEKTRILNEGDCFNSRVIEFVI